MIQNLIFVILFLKILFREYKFGPHAPVDIIRVFYYSRYSSFSKSIKTSEKDHSFQNTVSLKKYHSFYERTTLLTLKIICSQNTVKRLSQFTNFPANMFLFGVSKNIRTTPFPDVQELLSRRTLKANVCIFLYISLRNFFFKDVVRLYLLVWGVGEAEKFPQAACCLAL